MLDSFLMAFSLYSKIPVPQRQWNDKSMKYCICFLPLVGAVIGVLQYFAFILLQRLSLGAVFRGAVLSVLPVIVTGGIHMDGYLDTCDAIHSYGTREKKLEILKDPHVGAFAVMGGIVYFVLSLGIWSEAGGGEITTLCLLFPLSRALSAYAALTFPKAKKDGMLREETDPAAGSSAAAMAGTALLTGGLILWSGRECGIAAVVSSLAVLWYYRRMAVRKFGGTTGDLSGWFTQCCELVAAGAVVLVSHLPIAGI